MQLVSSNILSSIIVYEAANTTEATPETTTQPIETTTLSAETTQLQTTQCSQGIGFCETTTLSQVITLYY